MAHINENQAIRKQLLAHRDQVQQLIDHLDRGMGCGDLLAEAVKGYESLGTLCADLAVEHLKEHVTEVADFDARVRGAQELESLLRAAFK